MPPRFSPMVPHSREFPPRAFHHSEQQHWLNQWEMQSNPYYFFPHQWSFFDFPVPYGDYYQQHYFSDWSSYNYPLNCFPNQYMDPWERRVLQNQDYLNTCNALLKQIEYYFSDNNLKKDKFLRSKMDSEGWVSVDLISEFPRVKKRTQDKRLILKALQPSRIVEVQGNKMRKRGTWMDWISANGCTSSTPHKQVTSSQNLKLDTDSNAEPVAADKRLVDIDPNNIPTDAQAEMNIGTT